MNDPITVRNELINDTKRTSFYLGFNAAIQALESGVGIDVLKTHYNATLSTWAVAGGKLEAPEVE